jgi:site-specific DNA-cytosine methylase
VKNRLSKKHSVAWDNTLTSLKKVSRPNGKLTYRVQFKVLNSKHFGLAQNRERVYLVGCSRAVATRKFRWPTEKTTPSLSKFLDKGVSAVGRSLSATNHRNIDVAVAKAKAAGLDPTSVDIIVDIGCSASRTNMMHDLCPAITKSRAAGRDFWLMSAGRRLTVGELLRLQGFTAADLNLEGVSERQVGEMVGNAMSVPVLSAVLREGLSVCGMR